MLVDKIRALRQNKKFLLMPHLVLGAPSFEENEAAIQAMVNADAEIIEMQIPFSEPMADGPVILKANDQALKNGANTSKCFAFAEKMCAKHPQALFIFMTYYNVLFACGVEKFVERAASIGIQGLIVPDLPPEEGTEYVLACEKYGVSPIYIFTPTAKEERLKELASYCKGMAYCVGRKGVTGIKTQMDGTIKELIGRYKQATDLPIALGFGIQEKADVEALSGSVDIVVIGTKILMLHQDGGASAVEAFLKSLR